MKRAALLCVLFALTLPAGAADAVHEVDPVSGLATWQVEDQAFAIELIQLLPDFVRAVFAAKGLPREIVEDVAGYCVFGTIVRNRSAAPLGYNVADWRYVTADGVAHAGKTKSEWVGEWRDQGIAFRWTLLPEAQTFQVGDWGQGFTTVKLPPGTRFDLHYGWTQDGAAVNRVIRDMRCASEQIDK
ncbi:MAG: hypothetical protein R3F42_06815 [Pseudomonadota bacterium]